MLPPTVQECLFPTPPVALGTVIVASPAFEK